ncbi:kinase-like protein [Bimuria novae-zelandiae CBS 107.79]|uniref:Kinase-like protein n=1 Tax=Bimuria novae-zelandiae CBS 107.79 TaxID=1447943 RepID=A0A6A5UK32_9PLEO|nr:kinase-like protein [Bimuria novae-zelandiae CBS 107.79]
MRPATDLVRDSKLKTAHRDGITRHVIETSDRRSGHRRIKRDQRWQRVGDILGEGAFGIVWKETLVGGESDVKDRAVKRIRKRVANSNSLDYSRELEAIAKFSRGKYKSFFVESYGWFESQDYVFITMEYFEHGDLQRYMDKVGRISEEDARTISYQILEGVNEMHDNGFAHRDLKPSNVLIRRTKDHKEGWWVKIGDFGISKRAEEGMTTLRTVSGTEGFLAPEVLVRKGSIFLEPAILSKVLQNKHEYTFVVDIWALGEIIYRAICGRSPFTTNLAAYVNGKTEFPLSTLKELEVSSQGIELIQHLMKVFPGERLTAADALDHDWYNEFRDNSSRSSSEFESVDENHEIPSDLLSPGFGAGTSGSSFLDVSESVPWTDVDGGNTLQPTSSVPPRLNISTSRISSDGPLPGDDMSPLAAHEPVSQRSPAAAPADMEPSDKSASLRVHVKEEAASSNKGKRPLPPNPPLLLQLSTPEAPTRESTITARKSKFPIGSDLGTKIPALMDPKWLPPGLSESNQNQPQHGSAGAKRLESVSKGTTILGNVDTENDEKKRLRDQASAGDSDSDEQSSVASREDTVPDSALTLVVRETPSGASGSKTRLEKPSRTKSESRPEVKGRSSEPSEGEKARYKAAYHTSHERRSVAEITARRDWESSFEFVGAPRPLVQDDSMAHRARESLFDLLRARDARRARDHEMAQREGAEKLQTPLIPDGSIDRGAKRAQQQEDAIRYMQIAKRKEEQSKATLAKSSRPNRGVQEYYKTSRPNDEKPSRTSGFLQKIGLAPRPKVPNIVETYREPAVGNRSVKSNKRSAAKQPSRHQTRPNVAPVKVPFNNNTRLEKIIDHEFLNSASEPNVTSPSPIAQTRSTTRVPSDSHNRSRPLDGEEPETMIFSMENVRKRLAHFGFGDNQIQAITPLIFTPNSRPLNGEDPETMMVSLEDLRKGLARFGFDDNQIQGMIRVSFTSKEIPVPAPFPRDLPTYVKASKQHLDIETLQYYDLPYEIDENDPGHIIILREMEPYETNILFEHTRRQRLERTAPRRKFADPPNF